MINPFQKIYILLLLLAFSLSTFGQEVSFKAQVSHSKVGVNDVFELNYVISNAEELSAFNPPQIKGFQIVNGPMQSSNSYTEIRNGKTTITNSVIIGYLLKPTKVGKYTLPQASAVNGNSTIKSNDVNIEVVKESQIQQRRNRNIDPFGDPFEDFFPQQRRPQAQQQLSEAQLKEYGEGNLKNNIFIKVDVSNKSPYVGEQITATYKLYSRIPMQVNITELPSLNGFWSEEYQLPAVPQPKEEIINGKSYQVFELKKTALFPQQEGALTLDAAKAQGIAKVPTFQEAHPQHYADDPILSMFMNDPFFNNFAQQGFKEVPIKIASPPVTIHVKPLPSTESRNNFTGAVGQFSISTHLDKNTLSTDEVAKFIVTIKGKGNFQLMGVPTIDFPKELGVGAPEIIDSITTRSPEIEGIKKLIYYFNPSKEGSFAIPSITFEYFDPWSNSYKILNSNPESITIIKNSASEVITDIPQDQKTISSRNGLIFAIAIIVILLLVLIVVWIKRKKSRTINPKKQKSKTEQIKIGLTLIQQASDNLQNENTIFYKYLSEGLEQYLVTKLNIDKANKNIIYYELRIQKIEENQITIIENIFSNCQQALYSPFNNIKERLDLIEQTQEIITYLDSKLDKNH